MTFPQAAAFLICTSQLKHVFGVELGHVRGFVPTLAALAGPSNPSPLKVRFLPISQYLLELASGRWVLECGVLSCRGA